MVGGLLVKVGAAGSRRIRQAVPTLNVDQRAVCGLCSCSVVFGLWGTTLVGNSEQ